MYYPYVNPYSHLTEANGNLAIQGYGSDGRPKFRRSRTIFNPEQLEVLEQHFEKYKYPDLKRRKIISEEIGLPEERIQIWFQNRRAKDKRQVDQQVKLQKLVDEAMGGASQEVNRFNSEPGAAVSFHNPVEHLNQLSQNNIRLDGPVAGDGQQEHKDVEYLSTKENCFPQQVKQPAEKFDSISQWSNEIMEPPEPQVAIQNIDQDLLFKVANILSASNDATQLITEWSHSPNKLQTSSLEEQLRHFAAHHQKVLTDNVNMTPSGALTETELPRTE
ncbi:diencephalon/mesencephalon homeobox protein 1-B-like [Dendronephthya gigantea]|uniref:diencephalon/mesencephalon homeobox protein 1-B-like n=1 Tax=Dendronephthya gigantea TaxID=151771 RepID=UPI00106A7CFA|nr:diencephalon/mesencephalon homeobox protein 1-B-like [Dendronephthya gigantea]